MRKIKLIILLIFVLCISVMGVFYYKETNNNEIGKREESSIIISDPIPKEIGEGEIAVYNITLNNPCTYIEGKITLSGPAEIQDISGEGREFTINVIGKKGSGNIKINIASGAFIDSEENQTKEISKEGLIVDNTPALKSLIEDYMGSDADKMGLFYYDINVGKSFEINADTPYHPASVSKLYAVITLYDYALEGKIDINKGIYYTTRDYEGGAGILRGMDLSKPYALSTLAEYAIIYSDNIAFHMIYRVLGWKDIKTHYDEIVGHEVTLTDATPNMSARDAYLILRRIYENKDNNFYYNDLIHNMQNTTATNKIRQYLSHTIARKGGNYSNYHHDAAIIYADNPYILTVFSRGVVDANEKISQIAKLIDENR